MTFQFESVLKSNQCFLISVSIVALTGPDPIPLTDSDVNDKQQLFGVFLARDLVTLLTFLMLDFT